MILSYRNCFCNAPVAPPQRLSPGRPGPRLTSSAVCRRSLLLPGAPALFNAVVNGRFRPRVSDLGQRHPVTEGLTGAYALLDVTPYGRQQSFEDSPPGWPQKPTYG